MFEKRENPLVSIIIPAWYVEKQDGRYSQNETFELACKCQKRLLECIDRSKCEIIIIDNGSTLTKLDHEPAWSVKWQPDEYWNTADILIKNKTNLGFGPAMNQGVAIARGEYLLPLNNDIYVWPNFIENLLEVFTHKELNPPVGVAVPNLVKRNHQIDCLMENGKLDIIKVMGLKEEELVFPNKDNYEAGAEFGSAFLLHKDLVKKIKEINGGYGLYDERFIGFFSEDRRLWDHVRQCGFQMYRTNKLRVIHVGNLTVSKVPDKHQYGERNRELLSKLREEDK